MGEGRRPQRSSWALVAPHRCRARGGGASTGAAEAEATEQAHMSHVARDGMAAAREWRRGGGSRASLLRERETKRKRKGKKKEKGKKIEKGGSHILKGGLEGLQE